LSFLVTHLPEPNFTGTSTAFVEILCILHPQLLYQISIKAGMIDAILRVMQWLAYPPNGATFGVACALLDGANLR
jgi:hypothetical protein